jgi:hypothetical protein
MKKYMRKNEGWREQSAAVKRQQKLATAGIQDRSTPSAPPAFLAKFRRTASIHLIPQSQGWVSRLHQGKSP